MAKRSTPAKQGKGTGKGGVVPPKETRFKPGQSGNPAGRPSAGATIREWINQLDDRTETQLRAIARDKKAVWTKRAAAERILRTMEAGDLADYQPLLKGEKTLDELRADGMNTEVVKKFKVGRDGIELELHDRAGVDFDRILDRTDGKPKQSVDVTSDGEAVTFTLNIGERTIDDAG